MGRKAAVRKAAPVVKRSSGGFSPESDIGVTAPLGLFDPLNFLSRGPDAYRRYQEIEIKHGRLSMAATLGIIVTEAGIRFPGALSPSNGLDFSDVPGSLEGAYDTVPLAGWAQIVCLVAALDIAAFRQDPSYDAGDCVQDLEIEWVRYSDPEVKAFKLNAERNNGRCHVWHHRHDQPRGPWPECPLPDHLQVNVLFCKISSGQYVVCGTESAAATRL